MNTAPKIKADPFRMASGKPGDSTQKSKKTQTRTRGSALNKKWGINDYQSLCGSGGTPWFPRLRTFFMFLEPNAVAFGKPTHATLKPTKQTYSASMTLYHANVGLGPRRAHDGLQRTSAKGSSWLMRNFIRTKDI